MKKTLASLLLSGILLIGNSIFAQSPKNSIETFGDKKRALLVIANPETYYNHAFSEKEIRNSLKTIEKAGYDVFMDTASTFKEFLETFPNAVNSLGGKLDLYVGMAHGSSTSIQLSNRDYVYEDQLRTLETTESIPDSLKNPSKYFNSKAKGFQISCSVSDTSTPYNFAKALSDRMNIPITGLIKPTNGYIVFESNSLSLCSNEQRYYYSKISGLKTDYYNERQDSTSTGFFYDEENKKEYYFMYFHRQKEDYYHIGEVKSSEDYSCFSDGECESSSVLTRILGGKLPKEILGKAYQVKLNSEQKDLTKTYYSYK